MKRRGFLAVLAGLVVAPWWKPPRPSTYLFSDLLVEVFSKDRLEPLHARYNECVTYLQGWKDDGTLHDEIHLAS